MDNHASGRKNLSPILKFATICSALVIAVCVPFCGGKSGWRNKYGEDIADIFATIRENSPACFMKNHDLQEKLMQVEALLDGASPPNGSASMESAYARAASIINGWLQPYHIHVWLSTEKFSGPSQPAFDWEYASKFKDKIVVHFRSCDFSGDATSQKKFEGLLSALQSGEISEITFDMMGNSGGNSRHGSAIVETIFGEHAIDWLLANHYRATHYRLTADNLKCFEANGESNAEMLRKHFSGGKNMCVEIPNTKSAELFVRRKHTPHIRVIMDNDLFSAAGDFVTMLQLLDDTVEIVGNGGVFEYGYGDIDSRQLKSGLGSFIFPMKYFEMKDDVPMRIIPTHTLKN